LPNLFTAALAAWQLLLPGEKALCHKHTIFAIRFLIEGEGAYTAVGGKKMYMGKGDLILTDQCEPWAGRCLIGAHWIREVLI
jgi:gentisate 1,2-dioxygenase